MCTRLRSVCSACGLLRKCARLQTRACWAVSRGLILVAIPFKLVNDASQFIAPVFINLLLGVVANGDPAAKGYFYAGLMFAGLVIGTLCDAQHFQRTMRAGEPASLAPLTQRL